jgi:hypothetical protein
MLKRLFKRLKQEARTQVRKNKDAELLTAKEKHPTPHGSKWRWKGRTVGAFGICKYKRLKYGTKKRKPKPYAYRRTTLKVNVSEDIRKQERNRRRRIRRLVVNAPRVWA